MALLEANEVVAGYGATMVLHGTNVSVDGGEVITILGANGCGKSTLFKTIMGYLRPVSGTIRFDDEDVTHLATKDKVKRGIAYVPQLRNVFPSLKISENLEMAGFSKDRASVRAAVEEALENFPVLREKLSDRASTLSGGQRQMLAMAMALVTRPKVILLDEPSAGLDPKATETIFRQIEHIHEQGAAFVIIEQDAKRSLEISDRGYILEMGQNKFEDRTERLLELDEIKRMYFGD
ncbi:MAG: ABC transporter ATP-binding protein [Halofilum sp. (in: g-proteobacteria)]|nr:ABC transporter ATP-binding protein [Halofilum sp. (in: g-proteobacteria)]